MTGMSTAVSPRPRTRREQRARHRRPRRLRHQRRPGEGDDVPVAVPARAPRAAAVPDPRRRGRRRGAMTTCAPTRARRSRPAARRSTRRRSRASRRGSPTWPATSPTPPTFERVATALEGKEHPVFYLEIPPSLFGMVVERPGRRRADRARARRRREAVRARPGVGTGAAGRAHGPSARGAAVPDRPLPREDGPRGDPLPAVRERDLRADLEPQLRVVRADHDGRGLRRRRPRPLLRPGRRAARRGRQPPDAGGRRRRDGAAGGRGPAHAQGLDRGRAARHPRRRSGPLRARPARGLPLDRRRGRRTRRPRPTPRCAWTSRTGAGPACRSSSAPASASRRPRPRRGSCSAGRLGWGSSPRGRGRPSPTRSSSSSTRRPGIRMVVDAQRGDAPEPERDHDGHGVRRRGRRGRRPRTRSCSTPRCAATRCASRARTASRSSGGSCSRCSTPRRRCTRTRRAPGARTPATELPHGFGGWHGPWVAS